MNYATFEGFEICMTLEQAHACSHLGPCDSEVNALVREPAIAAQLDAIGPEKIRDELKGYGAWDAVELDHQEDNRARIVWCAACNIREDVYLMECETARAER